jgi:hypothetical protein
LAAKSGDPAVSLLLENPELVHNRYFPMNHYPRLVGLRLVTSFAQSNSALFAGEMRLIIHPTIQALTKIDILTAASSFALFLFDLNKSESGVKFVSMAAGQPPEGPHDLTAVRDDIVARGVMVLKLLGGYLHEKQPSGGAKPFGFAVIIQSIGYCFAQSAHQHYSINQSDNIH